jgi:DNA modification methylase
MTLELLRPYHREPSATIYAGDHLDILPRLDERADLIVTSPPYGEMRDYEGYKFDFDSLAPLLFDALKDGGVLVWVVGDETKEDDESGESFRQALEFKRVGFKLFDTMIYEKNGPNYPAKNKYFQVFEFMFVFSKGKPKTFNPIKDRVNRFYGQRWGKKRSRRNRKGELKQTQEFDLDSEPFGIRFNIWRFNTGFNYSSREEIAYEHPAIFPYQLAPDHIRTWTNAGDLIIDPMSGSGTTMRAAKDLGRRSIGIDCGLRYCEISRLRLAQEALPFYEREERRA